MDDDTVTINSGQGRCCHEITSNGNTNYRRTESPVNVMAINDVNVDAITDKIMSVVETTLFEELTKSGVSVDSGYGEEVVNSLVSRLYSLDISGDKSCNSKKRQRTESRGDAGLGGGDIIGTGGCDTSYTDTNNDAVNMAVDEESEESDENYNTAENNVTLQEKLGDVVSKDELNSSLATTGKLCIIQHMYSQLICTCYLILLFASSIWHTAKNQIVQ